MCVYADLFVCLCECDRIVAFHLEDEQNKNLKEFYYAFKCIEISSNCKCKYTSHSKNNDVNNSK